MSDAEPRAMTGADAFGRARELFESALDWAPDERPRRLRDACGGDDALFAVVQSMLEADAAPHRLLDGGLGLVAQLQPGDRVGSHLEIVDLLGRGGMGEVYRARDTTLGRDVALKILRWTAGGDEAAHAERLARLSREAQVLASLNHPNIAAIYGIETWRSSSLPDPSALALVLELVEGPTLAERLAGGALSVHDAIAIARQMAEALEAAHARGIVHRDLKPSNVALRPDGTVKLLDFGLAMPATRPTLDAGPDAPLGTPAYMSPEQARGRAVDTRGDIWAFGAVLFEMLSGQRAFPGDDAAACFTAIEQRPVDWGALDRATPPAVRALLGRCLERDARRRLRDIGEARILLEHPESAFLAAAGAEATPRSAWPRAASLAAAALAGAALVAAAVRWASAPLPPPVSRFPLVTARSASLVVDPQSRDVALTPDGRAIVYKGGSRAADGTQLFVRPLDRLEATALTTRGWPKAPFTSPDGRWVGFFEPVDGGPVLKKVAISGGPSTTVCHVDGASRGASWADDETIVLATAALDTGLQRVAASGGEPQVLTRPARDRGEADHLFPQVLPGGRGVLFTVTAVSGGVDAAQIAVLDLASRTWKTVLRGGRQAHYVQDHLVYVAGHALMAVPFDLARLETRGTPHVVLSDVLTLPTDTAEFDVAANGTLVYVTGAPADTARRLVWVDRDGRGVPVDGAPARPYSVVRLSPDGTRVALQIDDADHDVWVWDLARRVLTRVTTDPGLDENPVWTADGRSLIFTSQTGGASGLLFRRAADGSGPVERLTSGSGPHRASALLPGGDAVLIDAAGAITRLGIARAEPRADIRKVSSREQTGTVSPDGRWLASVGVDGGAPQVFVRPYPDVDAARTQVSPLGGTQPVWGRDGRELFYLAADGGLMRVPITPGPQLRAGVANRLFPGTYFAGVGLTAARTYDVSPDGRRFLLIANSDRPRDETAEPHMVVVLNWSAELSHMALDQAAAH